MQKNLLELYIAARAVWITNVEQLMTTHLWACPRGGLTHAEHWLVLDTIQPTNRKAGAADPSRHGDVAVSEEAMQKMIHGERIGKGCKGMEREKKEAAREREEVGRVIASESWCLKSPRFILCLHLQRCTTWPWGSQEASSPECELGRTDSPQTDWLMGYLSQPVSTKKKKERKKFDTDIHRTKDLTASSTSGSKLSLISTSTKWNGTRLCTGIHGTLGMSCNHFGDPLTFNLVPSSGLLTSPLLWFMTKYKNYQQPQLCFMLAFW